MNGLRPSDPLQGETAVLSATPQLQEGTSPVFGTLDPDSHESGKSNPLYVSQRQRIATKSASRLSLESRPEHLCGVLHPSFEGDGVHSCRPPSRRATVKKDLRCLVWQPLMGGVCSPKKMTQTTETNLNCMRWYCDILRISPTFTVVWCWPPATQ